MYVQRTEIHFTSYLASSNLEYKNVCTTSNYCLDVGGGKVSHVKLSDNERRPSCTVDKNKQKPKELSSIQSFIIIIASLHGRKLRLE